MDSPIRAHSPVGASTAYRFIACPGSVRMSRQAPEQKSSPYAEEGTAAHTLAERCFETDREPMSFVGEVIYKDFEVTEEMAEAVTVYTDEVRRLYRESPEGTLFNYEQRFHLDWLHEDLFGTNDACIYQPFGTLYVLDYKHGKGHAVSPVENFQLMYYALGASHKCNWAYSEAVLGIVQPRTGDGKPQYWETTPERLKEFSEELVMAVLETEKEDAPLVPGEEQCKFCPARGFCPALRDFAYDTVVSVFDEAGQIELLPPTELTEEQLAKVLDSASAIDSWVRAVEDFALQRATLQGVIPSGYKLVQKRANRKWKDEDQVREVLEPVLGDSIYAPRKILTPAQMDKVAKKEGNWIPIEQLYEKPEGQLTLTKISDVRAAKSAPTAIDVFGPIPEGE